MSSAIEIKSRIRVSGGLLLRVGHASSATKTNMTFAVFLPNTGTYPVAGGVGTTPYLIYLSGLTCTDENVCQKSGVFRDLADTGLAFVAPDTSPRGANIAGEDDSWDFGTGAGFYLDATQAPWNENYRMYHYVTQELPSILSEHFPTLNGEKVGILGHSMGGHGALTIALKNQSKYKSVSAFSPISHPSVCPWGIKAFSGYLGAENKEAWSEYDATELLQRLGRTVFDDILIDVGLGDNFYIQGQLLPEDLQSAATAVGQPVTLRFQEGYDHSYYFVSTFIRDHVQFHASRLN
jgi:S-formylglutathione hydrolase